MTIGELARHTREPVKTLRYWTDQTLLHAERDTHGQRHYTAAALERVAFIRRAQALGFSLAQINALLHPASNPCDTLTSSLDAQLETVYAQLRALESRKRELEALLQTARLEQCPTGACRHLPGA